MTVTSYWTETPYGSEVYVGLECHDREGWVDEVACSVAGGNVLHSWFISLVHRKQRTKARSKATDRKVFPVWPVSAREALCNRNPHSLQRALTHWVQVFQYLSP